jgi:hypothetical protein
MTPRIRIKVQVERDYGDTRVGHGVMHRYVILVELQMCRPE